jgi:hypothetical protein
MHVGLNYEIGQIQPDGSLEFGDSVGWTSAKVYLTNDMEYDLSFFSVGFGAYVRHPSLLDTFNGFGAHYKNPWNGCMSRDQLTALLIALSTQGKYWEVLKIILHHACWLFMFSYNTRTNGKATGWKWPDLTFFGFWALEIRSLHWWGLPLYPLLCLFDIHMVLNALYFNWFNKSNDTINLCVKLTFGRERMLTPLSWFAWKIANKDKLIRKITDYWSGWRMNPGMVPLYVNKIKELK